MGSVVVCLVLAMIGLLVMGKVNPKLLYKVLGKVEALSGKIVKKITKKPMKP